MDNTEADGYSGLRRRTKTKRRLRKNSNWLTAALERHAFPDRILYWGPAIRPVFIELYGPDEAKSQAAAYTVQTMAAMLLSAGALGAVGVLLQDGLIGLVSCMTFFLVPVYRFKVIRRKGELRKRNMVIELPAYVSNVMLLVGAGDAIPNAIIRAAERKLDSSPENPLYSGLAEVVTQLRHNVSLPNVLEAWSRRSGVREIAAFSTAVLLLQKRGGDEFVYAMNDLTRSLWEKRKAEARTAGEEAAAKLVFPMMIVFVVVMVIVGAPAYLMGMP